MGYSNNSGNSHERKSRANLTARVIEDQPWPRKQFPHNTSAATLDDVPSTTTNPVPHALWHRFCITPRRNLSPQATVGSLSPMRPSWVRYSKPAMEALKKLLAHTPFTFATMERKWLLPLGISTVISIALFLLATLSAESDIVPVVASDSENALENAVMVGDAVTSSDFPDPPRLAYLISGTKGDGHRMRRTLQALYHPRNYYLLHLDLEAPATERLDLARYVKNEVVFEESGNVYVVGKANLVTYRGPTMVAATLHGAAILLRKAKDWDWFINLSAADYPLVTQDDLLHVFSYLPKDLNFIEHTSDIGWKEFQRAKPIIIDPGLYQKKKSDIFWATQRRAVPTAFRLFTGSAWFALTRSFVDYTTTGYDNLPRTLLMYYTNFVSSPEGYFHTVLCNSHPFRNTTVNHDLHFIAWDSPPKQHPLALALAHLPAMAASGAAFARKFDRDSEALLDRIDEELLGRDSRKKGPFVPGGWCVGRRDAGMDPCSVRGDHAVLRPGPGAKRFEDLVLRLLAPENFRSQQCVSV